MTSRSVATAEVDASQPRGKVWRWHSPVFSAQLIGYTVPIALLIVKSRPPSLDIPAIDTINSTNSTDHK